jgi:DNA (cytosine-5)-methyltransferase 1
MTHLDLFSGYGGFHLGLKQSGFQFDNHYFSEIDTYAIANYKYNFPNAKELGTITDFQRCDIERPNIITFGSPCQDFSVAGKRKGIEGERSGLIHCAIGCIKRFKPDVFIWENVKGTFSSNTGKDFWEIIKAFNDIGGYRLEWQLVNTAWFLPQNRERIYLVGHLAGRGGRQVFPFRKTNSIYNKNNPTGKPRIANCLDSNYFKGWLDKGQRTHLVKYGSQNEQTTSPLNNKSSTIRTAANKVLHIMQLNPAKEFGNQPRSANRFFDTNGLAPTLLARKRIDDSPKILTTEKTRIRRLTEIECERLQGLPDDWTRYGIYADKKTGNDILREISATQRYKMVGNGVTVNVVQAIGERLIK